MKRNKELAEIITSTPIVEQETWEWVHFLKFLESIQPKTYLEIGVCFGAALTTVKKILPSCRCLGIDIVHPRDSDSSPVGGKYVDEKYFEFIQGNSQSPTTMRKLLEHLNKQKLDVLFIDGDHGFEGCYSDFKNFAPLARIVAFHDITFSPFSHRGGWYTHFVWEYLKTQYEWKEIITPEIYNIPVEERWGGIGILFLDKQTHWHPLETDWYG